jgi:hypothetical protein
MQIALAMIVIIRHGHLIMRSTDKEQEALWCGSSVGCAANACRDYCVAPS